jgi:hypothetical protein
MITYVSEARIKRLEAALDIAYKTTVPKRKLDDALGALRRCQELLGSLAATIEDLDVRHAHSDLMFEAKLYANVLCGFFDDSTRDWYDLQKGYDPRDYLTDKGAIKSTNPTRIKMEEKFVADRKAQQSEIDRLIAENDRKREARKAKRASKAKTFSPLPTLTEETFNEWLTEIRDRRAAAILSLQDLMPSSEPLAGPVTEVGPAHEYINKLRAEHGRGPIKPASKRGRPVGSKNKPKTGIVSKVNAILKANKKGASK